MEGGGEKGGGTVASEAGGTDPGNSTKAIDFDSFNGETAERSSNPRFRISF